MIGRLRTCAVGSSVIAITTGSAAVIYVQIRTHIAGLACDRLRWSNMAVTAKTSLLFRLVSAISIGLSAAFFAPYVRACSPVLPPVEEAVREVVASGYLISGTIVQPLDAAKRQPEIILADRIFVGEGAPREFKIYRTEEDYRRHEKPPGAVPCRDRGFKSAGFKWERFVLLPAPKQSDGSSDGLWVLYWNDGAVTSGKGYEMLLDQAEKIGRFRERPPANQWFDY